MGFCGVALCFGAKNKCFLSLYRQRRFQKNRLDDISWERWPEEVESADESENEVDGNELELSPATDEANLPLENGAVANDEDYVDNSPTKKRKASHYQTI